jgi:hypothetical protein
MKRKSSKIYVKKKSERKKSVKRPRKSRKMSSRKKSRKSKKDDFGVLSDYIKNPVKNAYNATYNAVGEAYNTVAPYAPAAAIGIGGTAALLGTAPIIGGTAAILGAGARLGYGNAAYNAVAPVVKGVAGLGAQHLDKIAPAAAVGIGGTTALLGAPIIGTAAGILGAGAGLAYGNAFKEWGDKKVNEMNEFKNDIMGKIPFTYQNQAINEIKKGVSPRLFRELRQYFLNIKDTQTKLNKFTAKFIKDCKQLNILLIKYNISNYQLQLLMSVVSQEINRVNLQIKNSLIKLKEHGILPQDVIVNNNIIKEFRTPNILTPTLVRQLKKSPIKSKEFEDIINGYQLTEKNKQLIAELQRNKPVIERPKESKEIETQRKKLTEGLENQLKSINNIRMTDNNNLNLIKNKFYAERKDRLTNKINEMKSQLDVSTTLDDIGKIVHKYNNYGKELLKELELFKESAENLAKKNKDYIGSTALIKKIKTHTNFDDLFFDLSQTNLKTIYTDLPTDDYNALDDADKQLFNRNINNINWGNADDVRALALKIKVTKNLP